MIKNKIGAFFLVFLFCCSFCAAVFALDQELEDYFFQLDQYRQDYQEFSLARDKFLKYKILSVRQAAIEATRKLLKQRNQTVRTYFLSLRYTLNTGLQEVEASASEDLNSQLNEKVSWFEEKNKEIDGLENSGLEELFVVSDEIEAEHPDFEQLSYQVLGEVILSRVSGLEKESEEMTSLLKNEIKEKRTATNSGQLDLWIREVEVKNYLATKEIEAGRINLWNITSSKGINQMEKNFVNLKTDANDAKLYLKQAVAFQKEILMELNHD